MGVLGSVGWVSNDFYLGRDLEALAAPQVLNRVPYAYFLSLPPLPSLPSHPYPSLQISSLPVPLVEGSQSHLPLPSLSLPSLFPFPGVPPPKPARGSGGAL